MVVEAVSREGLEVGLAGLEEEEVDGTRSPWKVEFTQS